MHVLKVSRAFFEKNLKNHRLLVSLREKDKIRKRNRAKLLIRTQHEDLEPVNLHDREVLFRQGDDVDGIYTVEEGDVAIVMGDNDDWNVYNAKPGNICGELTTLSKKPRNVQNATAVCQSKGGCKLFKLPAEKYQSLIKVRIHALLLRSACHPSHISVYSSSRSHQKYRSLFEICTCVVNSRRLLFVDSGVIFLMITLAKPSTLLLGSL